jgi:hypothetical protein
VWSVCSSSRAKDGIFYSYLPARIHGLLGANVGGGIRFINGATDFAEENMMAARAVIS